MTKATDDLTNRWMMAKKKAEALGHKLTDFVQNGKTAPIWIADCTHCLCKVIVDTSKPESMGVALVFKCDENAADKNITFPREPMSEAHKARLGPWKPPSEKG